jgi:hypothetical protein
MYPYYAVKEQLKIVRWQMRRASTARQYGKDWLAQMPVVFGNAIPKSGSHLINQVLKGLPKLGPFVVGGFPPVNRWEDNRKLSPEKTLANIQRMRPGDIGYGYVHCKPPFIEALTAPKHATIFIYRDPRDVVVSAVKYGAYMNKNHPLHVYYWEHLQNDEERYNAIIQGIDHPQYPYSSIHTRYQSYLGWQAQHQVLCLRFEDLVLDQETALGKVLDYLSGFGFTPQVSRDTAIKTLAENLAPERSGTYRKGQPGGWKENFTELNKQTFKKTAGDLLIQLGYEQDQDW